jgi:hypothetical protein
VLRFVWWWFRNDRTSAVVLLIWLISLIAIAGIR